jgi:arylsulfatase A-like enzyme
MNGDYDLIFKANFLNGAVRVPFIVSTPEIKESTQAGKTIDSLVEWFDAGPTLTDLAGAKINYTQFARSLVPVLQNPQIEHRRFAMSELSLEVMYLDHNWKLLLNREGESYRLFDVKKDPEEVEDLVGRKEYDGLITELKSIVLDRWMQTQEVRE